MRMAGRMMQFVLTMVPLGEIVVSFFWSSLVAAVLMIVRVLPTDGDGGGRGSFAHVDTAFSGALWLSL